MITFGSKGLVIEAGGRGNCLISRQAEFSKGTVQVTLAASAGCEAFLAVNATRGPGGWQAVTSRIADDRGTIRAGGLGRDFSAREVVGTARALRPGEFFNVKVESTEKGSRRLSINGPVATEIPGHPDASRTGGVVGLFVKSGTVTVQDLKAR